MRNRCFRNNVALAATVVAVGWLTVAGRSFAAEPPDGVTARAWAIADAETGELLWGLNEDRPAKAASTTKMMCAWVILQLAENDPKVLDEVVTFSKFAASTSGSSAKIREGERVAVGECLYGLLLPSGNDAGNALAEHFNDRLDPPETDTGSPLTRRSNFIAEMNRQAHRLGMTSTVYRIPYGDGGSAEEWTTTPRDLLTLARHAMQNERFRKYVSTRRYAAEVQTPDGGSRTAEWINTNQLLEDEAFDGIKTGTTSLAGACLVSRGRRGDRQYLMAVLGASSSDHRYSDSRKLYEWAWSQPR